MKIFLKQPDYKSQIDQIVKELENGNDVTIDNLDVLDEIIFDYPHLVTDASFIRADKQYSICHETVKDMRLLGYNVL